MLPLAKGEHLCRVMCVYLMRAAYIRSFVRVCYEFYVGLADAFVGASVFFFYNCLALPKFVRE